MSEAQIRWLWYGIHVLKVNTFAFLWKFFINTAGRSFHFYSFKDCIRWINSIIKPQDHILDIARRMLWFFNQNIQSDWVWFQYFSYNWSKNLCFTLKSIFLNFCYFLITPNSSECFDFKSELSELYKTEHFLKNHKTTSVRVYQSYGWKHIVILCSTHYLLHFFSILLQAIWLKYPDWSSFVIY